MANKIAWFTSHGRREAFNPTLDPPSFMPSSRKTGSYRGRLEAVAPQSFTCQPPRLCSVSCRFLLQWSTWGSWQDKGSEGKCQEAAVGSTLGSSLESFCLGWVAVGWVSKPSRS